MTKTIDAFLTMVRDNRSGKASGIGSICSAQPDVLRAAMRQALETDSIVLIESTSNQVDQFGGYTGMTPEKFVAYVGELAGKEGLPVERILLGGDHLGPNAWQNLPAREAMANARDLVKAYVEAGYLKIHLDASMFCADDPGDRSKPLADEIVAERAAELCAAAEEAWADSRQGLPKPVYVIGTEVPIPGGAQEEEDAVTPTAPGDALRTIRITKAAFGEKGLSEAWNRVVALVVQPGVEFGDDQVFPYDREAAAGLSALIGRDTDLIFEAHSTDYQGEKELTRLVEDHYGILKVGPWLTFAYREALFALEGIEKELLDGDRTPSTLQETLEAVMTEDPKHWAKYYQGDERTLRLKRKYSFSDRSRYYWPDPRLAESVDRLKKNLDETGIPLSLLSQFLPNQFKAVQDGRITAKAEDLVIDRIRDVIGIYGRASGVC